MMKGGFVALEKSPLASNDSPKRSQMTIMKDNTVCKFANTARSVQSIKSDAQTAKENSFPSATSVAKSVLKSKTARHA
jgi:hypothetical protein